MGRLCQAELQAPAPPRQSQALRMRERAGERAGGEGNLNGYSTQVMRPVAEVS